jgi:hypothetical protein
MHFGIYNVFHSQNSHQHVSAGIPDFVRVMFLVQGYSCGEPYHQPLHNNYVTITP